MIFHQYIKFLLNNITIYLIYRPPSGGSASIEDLTALISAAEKKSIFVGDFNLPEIDWEGGVTAGRAAGALLEAAENGLMEQLVTFSTHTRGNRLDLLLTNVPERVLDVQKAGRLGHSDHTMILARLSINNQEEVTDQKTQLEWRRANWHNMRAALAGLNWREMMDSRSGSEAWDIFKEQQGGGRQCSSQEKMKSQQTSMALQGHSPSNPEKETTLEKI